MPEYENSTPDLSAFETLMARMLEKIDANIHVSALETDELLFINKKMLIDYNLDENVLGQKCWKVLHTGRTERCSYCPAAILETNPDEVIVWEDRNPVNGKYYKNTNTVIEWAGGQLVHLHYAVDITAEKAIRQSLIGAKEEADGLSRAKSDFLSRMSHEIRTPLNAVIGMSRIGLGAATLDKAKDCLRKIDIFSGQLLALVNDLLDMSKIEAEKMQFVFEPFDFEKMMDDIIGVISVNSREKRQTLDVRIAPDMPLFYIGDALRISQVIMNLLSNAVKFTPEYGSVSVDINEKARFNNDSIIEVKISDTGIGIAKDHLPLLFTAFEQADAGIAKKFGGTGLGLAISKNIAVMLGGDIQVQSEQGKGSIFTFDMKLERNEKNTPVPSARPDPVNGDRKQESAEDVRPNTVASPDTPELDRYINVADALARVRGNSKIYQKLLQSFVGNSYIPELAEQVKNGDFTEAAKTAHSIKGASANLSLVGINSAVVQLESQLKEGGYNKETLDECITNFEKTKELIEELANRL